jgi:twitching motility protein PilT
VSFSTKEALRHVDPDGFATLELLSGRVPRVVKGETVLPLSRDVMTDDEVLSFCREAGAGEIVDRVGIRPESWTFQGPRGPCIGTVVTKGREVLATFRAKKRAEVQGHAPPDRTASRMDPRAEVRTKPPTARRDSRSTKTATTPPTARTKSAHSLRPASTTKAQAMAAASAAAAGRRKSSTPPRDQLRHHEPDHRKPDQELRHREPQQPAPRAEPPAPPLVPAPAPTPLVPAPPPAPIIPAPPPTPRVQEPPQLGGRVELAPKNTTPSRAAHPALGRLLREARSRGASDLHVSTNTRPEARLPNGLAALAEPTSASAMSAILEDLLTPALEQELERDGGASFAVTLDGLRLRVNASTTLGGSKLALRLLDPAPRPLAELGLPSEIEQAVHHHQGLVLLTGPSGQGKTTTLAALVDHVNATRACHIIAVEDPVEIPIVSKRSMVSQREVHTSTRSFERALKGALRQDPDVIVVGELRDMKTVQMALSASETGHLVLGTMNTPSTAATIDRLIDFFPPGDQPQVRATLAAALRLIVNQRLLPHVDGSSRVPACELLPGSLALSNLIRDDKLYQLSSLMQRGRGAGILRLAESVQELVAAGTVHRAHVEHLLPPEREPAREAAPARAPDASSPDGEPREPDETGSQSEGLGGLLTRAGAIFRRGGS